MLSKQRFPRLAFGLKNMPSEIAKPAFLHNVPSVQGQDKPTRIAETVLYLALASLALSWVALFNRAPLVFADTVGYATAALGGWLPGFFSVFYSVFILPLHWGSSLWPVVFVQGAIIAHLLYLTARTVSRASTGKGSILVVVIALAVFSSLPWLTGEIMPDIFTPVVAIGLYLIAFQGRGLGRGEIVYVSALTAFAISTHLSHVPIAAGLILLLLVLRFAFETREKPTLGRVAGRLAIPFLVAIAAMFAVNWFATHGVTLARNSNAFLLAKWIDEGPALAYLKESCPSKGYTLCAHLDELEGKTHAYLKWSADSPLRKLGFDALEPEARDIVRGTLFSRPFQIVHRGLIDFAIQLSRFQTGDGLSREFAKLVSHHLTPHYGAEVAQSILASRQGRGQLPLTEIRIVHSLALAVAAGFLLYILLLRRNAVTPDLLVFSVFVFGAVVWNAAATGALSGPYDRYLARVVWLIDFAAILGLLQLTRPKRVPLDEV